MRRSLIIFTLTTAAILAFVITDERNATSLLDPSGTISNGQKFGVRIGDTSQAASSALRDRGFSDLTVALTDVCMGRKLGREKTLYAYDRSWRAGYVCVGFNKGQVTTISWLYNFITL
jgi:hypothetical protein